MKKLLIDTPEEIAARFEGRLAQKEKREAGVRPSNAPATKTLRDEFAMAALTGLLASGPYDCDQHGLASDAYLYADAMLAAREEGGGE